MTPKPAPDPKLRHSKFMAWAMGLVVAALLLVFLVKGRDVLIPLVLAGLLSSIISALIDRLRSIRIGGHAISNTFASVLAVVMLVLALSVAYSLAAQQINLVMQEAPAFIAQTQTVVLALASSISDELAESLQAAFSTVTPRLLIVLAAGSAGSMLTTSVLIAIYVGFLLAERPWVQAKVNHLFPDDKKRTLVQANITTIRQNVHHFLVLKTIISAVTGGVVYLLALAFGLKFALTLGLLTFFLNFIPNLGSILATALPVLVALVQFDSVSMALSVLAVLGVTQFVLGNVIDPMVMGRSLQMSSLGIVVSLTFWSAVWGIVGMFLAVPLMVIAMIICSQIRPLRPVAILLSKTGELPDTAQPDV